MQKPYVICHMMASINGKILSENWGTASNSDQFVGVYEKCHESFNSNAWFCGRLTMEKDFSNGIKPEFPIPETPIAREAYIANPTAKSFAIALDASGKLGWETNEIYGDHIIEVLTEQVSDSYLYYLQQKEISYIFGGAKSIDFKLVLQQLYELFSIEKLMLEGGGHINGAMLEAGLIDELSLILLPIADATANTPTIFEHLKNDTIAVPLKLKTVEPLQNGALWLRYKF
ncbi:deaminase [Flavobacterium sp. Sd200]|uniref:dihydrofolate reductase family protein n=1 Tax=Flavobacterium sp. Sd200 TaxID=2692211 RepID=UPI0013707B6D|nr:dihydrofolate reductase family protein [Flavobacterium sp. Sd200]MXN90509.1 deaminase [Flavobacterium sp. Sd200]